MTDLPTREQFAELLEATKHETPIGRDVMFRDAVSDYAAALTRIEELEDDKRRYWLEIEERGRIMGQASARATAAERELDELRKGIRGVAERLAAEGDGDATLS